MTRRIQFVVRNKRFILGQAGTRLLIRPESSLLQREVRRRVSTRGYSNLLYVSPGDDILRDTYFIVTGEERYRCVFPIFGEDHVNDILIDILGVDFCSLKFLGRFHVS